MVEQVETVVIGAGVIGLAIARSLALSGREVIVLERESAFGSITSARNSEVIHAGIYYDANSLKARLCVQGRKMLYDFCKDRGVGHKRCGKLIVACEDSENPTLADIAGKARRNGVDDLQELSAADARAMEPNLSATAALLSPSTGIVDSHGLMLALLGEAEANGAMLALNTPVERLAFAPAGFDVHTGGDEPMTLRAKEVVNAAGLNANDLARTLDGLPEAMAPPLWLAKGNYYQLSVKAPFERLIYPAPAPGGLGIHITLDLQGRARFGPDVEWVTEKDYSVDPARSDSFYAAIRRYWPELPDGSLTPDYAGIRPKLSQAGKHAADFLFSSAADHGLSGYLGLYGIESPGLTSSLAIAEHARELLDRG